MTDTLSMPGGVVLGMIVDFLKENPLVIPVILAWPLGAVAFVAIGAYNEALMWLLGILSGASVVDTWYGYRPHAPTADDLETEHAQE